MRIVDGYVAIEDRECDRVTSRIALEMLTLFVDVVVVRCGGTYDWYSRSVLMNNMMATTSIAKWSIERQEPVAKHQNNAESGRCCLVRLEYGRSMII